MSRERKASDDALRARVFEELTWEPSVASAHIGVTARDGVVSLTGAVGSYAEKHAAEGAALRVNGVKAVAEDIDVRLPVGLHRRDDEIATAVLHHLAWNAAVPKDVIKIEVEHGAVTLSGQVEWHFQKAAAARDVRRMVGVTKVTDLVTIKPQVDSKTISDDIQHALHRSWLFDPELVHVSVDGGQVKLSGAVHSPHDRQTAAMTAWAAHGATSVENNITVN